VKVPDLSSTRRFYNDLTEGHESRGVWGYEKRFDPARVLAKPSVQRHFTAVVAPLMKSTDVVLDLGCGPGGFLAAAAPFCQSILGVDVVPAFVEKCREAIASQGISNASAILSPDGLIPSESKRFDVVMMVDTIHHCDDPRAVLDDVHRVLKPSGRLLVFEPNKLNPALAAMCALDRNEWGLLRLGTRGAYRRLLAERFAIERNAYSGLLVGPEAGPMVAIADFVSTSWMRGFLGWLSPKIFIAARSLPSAG
jgi:SAM-dependent methyltransferase